MTLSRATLVLPVWLLALPITATAMEPQAIAPSKAESVPDTWAKPLQIDGVENGYQVSKGLYRSAQPTAAGLKNLKELGVKTVVTLRAFHSDRQAAGDTGLVCESMPMLAWQPSEKDVVRFLKLVSDPDKSPVLVHCQYGADRTGLLCAVYRVAVEGWTKEAAIAEMTHERYGFHKVWINIPPWIEKLDIDQLRSQAGLSDPRATATESTP